MASPEAARAELGAGAALEQQLAAAVVAAGTAAASLLDAAECERALTIAAAGDKHTAATERQLAALEALARPVLGLLEQGTVACAALPAARQQLQAALEQLRPP
jgi:hypothetical protein